MRRIDATIGSRPRVVLGVWLVVIAAAAPLALRQSDHLTASGFSVPGSQSARVSAVLTHEFPAANSAVLAVLLWPQKGATAETLLSRIEHVRKAMVGVKGVTLTPQVRELAAFAAELGEPVVMPLRVTVSEDQARSIVKTLAPRLGIGQPATDKVEVHLLGESALWAGLEETAKSQLTKAEIIGFPILFLVLLGIFGSLEAALVPLVIAAVTLVVTGAAIYLLSSLIPLSIFTIDAASMLGIGIAIDYSLIILARVRQELAGRELADARRVALATSGSAVAFSGATVVAALSGVLVVPLGALRSMALGAAVIVAVSVAAATTLLPALVTLLGARRVSRDYLVRGTLRHDNVGGGRTSTVWDGWTGVVTRRPLVVGGIVGALVLALCIPVLSMRTDTGVLQQLAPKNPTRLGFSEAAQVAGPGVLGPVSVLARAHVPVSRSYLEGRITALRQIAGGLPNVHVLGRTEVARDGAYATFTVVPDVDPESSAAEHLVTMLRQSLPKRLVGTRLTVAVGGATATQLDEVRKIAGSMWKLILTVVAISLVPLAILLRSAVLPLKAIAMNLLSVGVAYGVLVIVFQWGWLDSLLDYRAPGHIDTLVPPLLLSIALGLSTDYEMFLLSRIRERWLACGDAKRAVIEGLAASARTITGAAIIIVCVFAVFLRTGIPIIKELGLGSAVAIGVDATLIRLALVPATMTMLGEWAWWRPGLRFAWRSRDGVKPVAVSAGPEPWAPPRSDTDV
jgi:RND superfamily putative drug exporter